jgi:hypothetical protein
VGFRADDAAGSLAVSLDGAPLFDYVYRSPVAQLESPRPYFHPVSTLAGEVVTLSRPDDHVWHTGLSWSLPNVGAHNFWGGPTYVRDRGYVQLPNNGSVQHRGFTALEATDDRVEVEEMLQWMSQAGDPVFTERRRLTVTAAADRSHWTLGLDIAMRNVTREEIRIGSPSTEGRENAGYGGLFWRGPNALMHGDVITAAGVHGEEAMGSRADWMAYSTPGATVVIVDGAANPRHPTPWFVRSEEYAGLCPAPFFAEELAVASGASVRFAYDVVIATGASDATRAAALAASAR